MAPKCKKKEPKEGISHGLKAPVSIVHIIMHNIACIAIHMTQNNSLSKIISSS